MWNLSEPRVEVRMAAPGFGQHNDDVLQGLLGLPGETIALWRETCASSA